MAGEIKRQFQEKELVFIEITEKTIASCVWVSTRKELLQFLQENDLPLIPRIERHPVYRKE
jgi:hypothetical protein